MRRITLRQLRDTGRLKAYLRRGEPVELCERTRVLATIRPAEGPEIREWPDFAGLSRTIFGGRVLTGADILLQGRRGS